MNNQEANNPNVQNPNSNIKTDQSVLNRQARAAQILGLFGITRVAKQDFCLREPFNTKVKVATEEQVHAMIAAGFAGTKDAEVAIVDLRTPVTKDEGDKYHLKLKGAFAIPMEDGKVPQKLVAMKDKTVDEPAWKALEGLPDVPLKALFTKPVIVVHCFASTSRTPMFVGGYVKNYGIRKGQQLVILEGGFSGYIGKYGAHEPPTDITLAERSGPEMGAEVKVTQMISTAIANATK